MQMDQVTQQNAALVEEATAAAGSLEDQVRQLREAVAVFRLPEGDAYPSGHDGDTDVAANGPRGAVLAFARERQVA